jgi:thiamine kinase-like enzyme
LNSNWRVRVDGDDFFVKVPGPGSETYIDRDLTHVAAKRAGDAGISARQVAYFPDTGVEVIEFLDGYRACTNGDMKRSEIMSAVLAVQDAFHSVEPLPVTKTIFDMIAEHRAQVAALGVRMPPDFASVMREYDAAHAAFTASGLDIVPCHNDPMPGNFLIADGKPMMLVDFEFASNNERSYELGLTLCEFFYDERHIIEAVEQVYGRAEWSLLARVQVSIALADIKWGMWGCVNHQLNDTWDFDYHKYGAWKFARAAAKVADPRWPLWLSAL